jgi:hypothetical protein
MPMYKKMMELLIRDLEKDSSSNSLMWQTSSFGKLLVNTDFGFLYLNINLNASLIKSLKKDISLCKYKTNYWSIDYVHHNR